MFSKELSTKISRLIGEKGLTVTSAAELAHISRNSMNNVVNGEQNVTIKSLENICSAFQVNPDEILISEKSKTPDKAKPMQVTKVYCHDGSIQSKHNPICPNCNKLLGRDHQAYCDNCGQRLSWSNYTNAELVCKLPDRT